MRKLALLALFTSIVAVPLHAAGRSQSYFSYDDGGTIVRQGEDAREIEARVNMPVYPGDEVTTSRRGRVEIRLSDGNVLGLDRSTSVLFHSILDSYEGESSETIAELHFGHIAVLRTSEGQEVLRIDTENASYIATDEATYAVDTDRGRDRVTVYAGAVEVRTPNRTTRVRAGDEAKVDSNGLYGLISDSRSPADDFEIWFNSRAERYGSGSSRYLDRSLAYADSDLADNGSWTYVSGFGAWAWRPNVAAGWRPYYYGSWNYGPGGCLTWVSYEPWGWVPYHYGRWAYDPLYGWVWLPGGGYAPAWVYWMYGPNYVGWAPSGWWDCYKPYYNWCYRPYAHVGRDFGFGFYGRVRIGDIDLRPWTFVNPNAIMSTRVDRAALTTDAIRDRLGRNGGGFATVSNNPARFTRNELKDPDTAVNVISRRGLGSGTGKEGTGSTSDMTPFFRRDPDLSSNVRDRITRGARPSSGTPAGGGSGGVAPIGSGSVAPIGSGNVAPIGGGNVAPIGGGNVAPATGDRLGRGGNRGDVPADSGRIDRGRLGRGTEPATGDHPATTDRPTTTPPPPTPDWRNRAQRPSTPPSAGEAPPAPAPKPPDRSRPDESWRGRAVGRQPQPPSGTPPTTPAATPPADRDLSNRGSDVPRRVIDRIGGARVYPGDSGRGTPSAEPRSTPPPSRDTAPPRRESSPPPPPRAERPSSGERNSSPPPARHEAPSSRDNSDGGKVHRDH